MRRSRCCSRSFFRQFLHHAFQFRLGYHRFLNLNQGCFDLNNTVGQTVEVIRSILSGGVDLSPIWGVEHVRSLRQSCCAGFGRIPTLKSLRRTHHPRCAHPCASIGNFQQLHSLSLSQYGHGAGIPFCIISI